MKNAILILLLTGVSTFLLSIQVSGTQSGTWSPDNNPYEVIGDVTVPSGQTLSVQPGVIVQAMGLFQIIAQGNIIANGTVADSIYFISGQADPNALWDGIRLENTIVQSQFSYCRIEKADYGINSINSPASITHCHFKLNKRGIQTYGIGSTNPADVLIDHNLIELTIQNGILVAQNSNTLITNNEITRNGTSASYYGAIQLSNQSAGGSNSPEIAYNHIHHNYKQGIIAWDIVAANAINPEVHHNLVENNLTGIYFRNSSGYLHHNTVINNFIPGDMNSGAGIMVSGSTAEPYFEDNVITGNYTGFYLTENAQPCLGNLMIYHAWAQGGNTIANNIDANNVMHSVYCYSYTNSAITVSAENNFWDYNTATEIAGTIEDHNDNPSLPTVDFDPWQNNAIPIYLAGTVVLPNPTVDTATLELVSAQTGDIVNQWTVNINEPFSVPVYYDSLVYIVAHTMDMFFNHYYGAYGGIEIPTATQIVADVQFNIGDLILTDTMPDSYLKAGLPVMIGAHLSYPVEKGFFVYAPTEKHWLYRDGDYLRISRFSRRDNDSVMIDYTIDSTPIWRKILNLVNNATWEQFWAYNITLQEPVLANAEVISEITSFSETESFLYDLINLEHDGGIVEKQLYDRNTGEWNIYDINASGLTTKAETETDFLVEPDGTLFPLVTGNYWKIPPDPIIQLPHYFGYKLTGDGLDFYWIPPNYMPAPNFYKLYDNGVFQTQIDLPNSSVNIPIPSELGQHTYSLSGVYNSGEYFALNDIIIVFTAIDDNVQPVQKLSVFPNPFNPALTQLTVQGDLTRSADSKLAIYNLKGQLVWSSLLEKGVNQAVWDGRDNHGRVCSSGIYQLVISDGKGRKEVRKVMLIR